jgi:DNA-binding GntR family transcriptional regulator
MDQISSARLRADLAIRIIDLIETGAFAPGDRLTETGLAARLQVSRTPVRGALTLLAAHRVVEAGARGFVVAAGASAATRAAAPSFSARPGMTNAERLAIAIAADRRTGVLPSEVSEAELMRRYDVPRAVMKHLMGQLATLGVAERKRGHGWLLLPGYEEARGESYRWRLMVEPAALLEPAYTFNAEWAAEMRDRHEQFLRDPWHDHAAIRFFALNSAFHEGLCAGAGNRFIDMAMQQQTQLRRLGNYNWVYGVARVHQSCQEHLAILDQLLAGDHDRAAALLRRHIERAMQVRR